MPLRGDTHGAGTAALIAVAGIVLALPGGAAASSVTRAGDTITFRANSGEANNVSVRAQNATVDVFDTGSPLAAGPGCVQVSASEADCGPHDSPRVVVLLDDGNDTMQRQSYALVGSMEVHGGSGDDSIIGSIVDDKLYGEDGNDSVDGYDANDLVSGGSGSDSVAGGSENDVVDGGPGADTLNGDGSNPLYDGSDQIVARDGERDTVTCGFGVDTVSADSLDVLDADGQCESVDRGDPEVPTLNGGGGTLSIALKTKSTGKISSLLSRKGFVFRVRVSSACRASVSITVGAKSARRLRLGRRMVTLARATDRIPTAGRFQVTLRARARYRARLRSLRRVPTTVRFSCVTAGTTRRAHHQVAFRR